MALPARFAACLVGLFAMGSLHGAELIATADTWVHGSTGYTANNHGGGEFMKVRPRGPRIALIRFDTSALAAGAASGATLSLHVSRVVSAGAVQIRPVAGPWSETEVTFDTRPPLDSEVIGTLNVMSADTGGRVSVDISTLVAAWIADPDSNFGLAITADGTSTSVFFGTRDVGTPPQLSVVGTNSVTVSATGGDYNDPIAAASNALAGDTWCVTPTPAAPCTMMIDRGTYVLSETLVVPEAVAVIGAGKTETVLAAAPGISVAAEVVSLSDLSVLNLQTSSVLRAVGLRPFGGSEVRLTRVVIRAEGAMENAGLEAGQSSTVVLVTESDIAAAGGQNAFAIDMNTGSDTVDVRMSRITATGATESNEGITKFMDTGGQVRVTDTTIVASGGRRAAGISVSDEEGGNVTVIGGSILASAFERAFGIGGGEISETLSVEGARIIVESGGEAFGIGWGGVRDSVLNVSDVFVDSSDVAVTRSVEDSDSSNVWTITRSQLFGQRSAIDIGHREFIGTSVSIDRSVLSGEEWIGTGGGEDVIDVSNSVLLGENGVEGAGTTACTNALGSDYEPLDAGCLPVSE